MKNQHVNLLSKAPGILPNYGKFIRHYLRPSAKINFKANSRETLIVSAVWIGTDG